MPHPYVKRLFTDPVKKVQEEYGVRELGQQLEDSPVAHDVFAERERTFIETRDSFYMATVNSEGWPYVQHRGGPKGFLRVIDNKTIAFPDFRGNDQYISMGNLRSSNKISLILMDYPNRRRLKILGYCKVVTERENLMQVAELETEGYGYAAHRAMIVTLDSFDWNCPQHIVPRYTQAEIKASFPQPDISWTNLSLPTIQDVEKFEGAVMPVEVTGICKRAENISEFILSPLNDSSITPDAGSHIRIAVRSHDGQIKTNAYSLINGPEQNAAVHIAILRETDGGGGSRFMHDVPRVGDHLYIQPPKNDFPLVENAEHTILIAGGIGITPILSMARTLSASGDSLEIHYTARTHKSMAFKQQVADIASDNSHFYFSREEPVVRLDLEDILSEPKIGIHIYACGPKVLIDAVITIAEVKGWPKNQIHFELFGNPLARQDSDKPIEVELRKSGKTVHVASDQSVLDVLLGAGVNVGFSCKRGECGNCKVPVLEGDIDHRDIVLDTYEKEVGNVMCSCVSRVKGNRLVLDL
ncbi:MAG: pyridoxamine 5'-phosphate oxidase family protein [Nitrosomonas sp.]|nr:pyridoxamine 5'-phosphate oxidase family protein [Nitrosomonas sp.]